MKFELLKKHKPDIWLFNGIRANSVSREPETVQWVKSLRKGVLYDVGANIGAYSLIGAVNNPKLRVFAFEPMYKNFFALMENVIYNKLQERVYPFSFALSNELKLDRFNYNSMRLGSALSAFGEAIDYKGDKFDPVFKQPMLSFTIDFLVDTFGFPQPNFIKLDVDSIEFDILKGAEKVLRNVSSILVEADPNQFKDINAYLVNKAGFQLTSSNDHKITTNYIYEKK